MVTKLLITGGTGRLGKELVKLFPSCLHPTRQELNLSDEKSIYGYVERNKPDNVIHLAALTGIPPCENNKELAWQTNVEGTRHLSNACWRLDSECYFIYMSTPCVFDGKKGMYTEVDIPNPENFYGLTKLLGEVAVTNSPLRKKLIIRANFVPKERWPYEGAFADRYGTYLFSHNLAEAIRQVVQADVTGSLHIIGQQRMSMLELARLTTPEVKPMSYQKYLDEGGYRLTQDMSLDTIHQEWKRFKIC